ncbi:MAG: hypothetical protein LBH28_01860 [Oscillospiraceae bacterium]|jgi:hypothetical protein|nr:hypothetical protein [Oscillospiraceae bacterium]
MEEMSCNVCGIKIVNGVKFCPSCGSKVDENNPGTIAGAVKLESSPVEPQEFQPAPIWQQYQAPPVQSQPIIPPTPPMQPQPFLPPAPPVPATSLIAQKQTVTIRPLGVWDFLWTMLLFVIPVVGQVMAFLWAFRKKTNKNRKAFAIAFLILFFIGLGLFLLWFFINCEVLMVLINAMLE